MRSWGGVPREIFITYSPMGRLSLTGLWKSVLDISKRALRRSDRSIEAASRSEWLALVLSGESGWSLWINSVRSTLFSFWEEFWSCRVGRAAVDVPETHRNITTEFMSNKHLLPPDAAMVAARLIECGNCQRLPTTYLVVRRNYIFFPLSGTLTRVTYSGH